MPPGCRETEGTEQAELVSGWLARFTHREVPLARPQPCPWCFNQDRLTPGGSFYLARCGWGRRMGIAPWEAGWAPTQCV